MILGRIYEGLEDMDIDEVAEQQDDEFPKLPFRRAIAGLLVQPHDYIIRAGTEIEVLSTGEADIYLRIGEFRDASVPPLCSKGRRWGLHRLEPPIKWPKSSSFYHRGRIPRLHSPGAQVVASASSLETKSNRLIAKTGSGSGRYFGQYLRRYRLPNIGHQGRMGYFESPIQRRPRRNKPGVGGCQPIDAQRDADEDQSDPDTPRWDPHIWRNIRQGQPTSIHMAPALASRERGYHRYYCTLKCLRGTLSRGELDQACPNVRDHGKGTML